MVSLFARVCKLKFTMDFKISFVLIAAVCVNTCTAQTLAGRHLTVTTIPSPPLVIVNSNSTQTRFDVRYAGYLIDILEKLAYMANFTYNIHVVNDNRYGSQDRTGVWNGMIGEIVNDVADIAVAPLTIVATRASVVHYTQPIIDSGLRILYRKTAAVETHQSIMILLVPFTTGLWFIIIACFVVAGVVFFCIGKLSPFEAARQTLPVGDVPLATTLVNAVLYSLTSFLHQERNAVPRSTSGRVMSVFWWTFSTLVVTTFAANFTAVLLSKSPDVRSIPFMSFDELSRQDVVKFGSLMNGYTQNYFAKSKRPLEQRMQKKMSNTNSMAEGMARVRSENYAFIMEGPTADYLSGKAPCDTMVVGMPINDRAYGFACGKNSDVCSLLNPYILKLKQVGMLAYTRRKWLRSGECHSPTKKTVTLRGSPMIDAFRKLGIRLETQMSFSRFSAALFVLVGGVALSMVVLGAEIGYVKKFGLPQK